MANDVALSIPDFAAKATENYARFVAQAQEFLAKVYRGEVAPAALQQQLPEFLQERGSAYYLELQQICFQFFRSLMDLSATYGDDFFRGLLPDMPSSDAQPFVAVPQDLHDWTHLGQKFSSHVVDQNGRTLLRYQHLLRKIASGELSTVTVQEYSREFSNGRNPEYARKVADANAQFFDGLLRLNQHIIDDLFKYLDPEPNSSSRDGRSLETLTMELTGPSGSTVSASLMVENKQPGACDVSCSVSDFRSPDGSGPTFRAAVAIEPLDLRLLPEETRTVSVRLALDPNLFAIGRTYMATLIVKGQSEQDILVFLTARATAS